jgi:hypothetical protein
MSQKLVFVYNANSGFLNAITDFVHKSVKPSTYPCDLCKITFDGAAMNKIWKKYISNLSLPTEFLHKDEFEKKYPKIISKYPVVLMLEETHHISLISVSDFKNLNDVPSLMALLSARLENRNI